MKKVYLVNHGCYSDYSIDGVFSTKEKADEYMRLLPRDGFDGYNDVEERVLDSILPQAKRGYTVYQIVMLRNGDVEQIFHHRTEDLYLWSGGNNAFLWERTKAPAYIGRGIPDALSATVWARNEKHAIKIVNEYRAKMIANGEWK